MSKGSTCVLNQWCHQSDYCIILITHTMHIYLVLMSFINFQCLISRWLSACPGHESHGYTLITLINIGHYWISYSLNEAMELIHIVRKVFKLKRYCKNDNKIFKLWNINKFIFGYLTHLDKCWFRKFCLYWNIIILC